MHAGIKSITRRKPTHSYARVHGSIQGRSVSSLPHNLYKKEEGVLLWHVHQQQSDDEGAALAVADLGVI